MARTRRLQTNDRQLGFKLTAQSVGVQKAYNGFVSTYGVAEGRRIMLAYADEHGVGNTPRQRCDSVFTKGRHLPR